MKSNIFETVLETTTIESGANYQDTINRLISLQGICREKDSDDGLLEFICTKKGKLMVYNLRPNQSTTSHRVYYVCGQVFEEGGKTKVNIYTVHDRTTAVFKWISLFLNVALLVLYVLWLFLGDTAVETSHFAVLLPLTLSIILLFYRMTKEEKYKSTDIDIMKDEIIRRVEAVRRWND